MRVDTNHEVLALERSVLDRWARGDPYGFVENATDDVTWFDHTTRSRIDGKEALSRHVEQFVGAMDIPRYEMPNVQIRILGDFAMLTSNWHTYAEEGALTSQWNATEVYRREGDAWKYVHVHWAPVSVAG